MSNQAKSLKSSFVPHILMKLPLVDGFQAIGAHPILVTGGKISPKLTDFFGNFPASEECSGS